jgi:hypothetical protein
MPRELDLTDAYTDTLDNDAFHDHDFVFSALPKGLNTFDGVLFDVRGMIVLFRPKEAADRPHPVHIPNIPVGQKCRVLHALQASGRKDPIADGTVIGRYLLHYAAGQTVEGFSGQRPHALTGARSLARQIGQHHPAPVSSRLRKPATRRGNRQP